jgi:hypothetical protein
MGQNIWSIPSTFPCLKMASQEQRLLRKSKKVVLDAESSGEKRSVFTKRPLCAMILTILEASVAPDQWTTLELAYQKGIAHLPAQMVQTFLVQQTKDSSRWQILSLWHSREALDEYRQATGTPEGILWFRAAGAEPTLVVSQVVAHAAHLAPE